MTMIMRTLNVVTLITWVMTTTGAIISVAMIIMMILKGTYDDHYDGMVIKRMITATYDLNLETSARKRLMVSLKLKVSRE